MGSISRLCKVLVKGCPLSEALNEGFQDFPPGFWDPFGELQRTVLVRGECKGYTGPILGKPFRGTTLGVQTLHPKTLQP